MCLSVWRVCVLETLRTACVCVYVRVCVSHHGGLCLLCLLDEGVEGTEVTKGYVHLSGPPASQPLTSHKPSLLHHMHRPSYTPYTGMHCLTRTRQSETASQSLAGKIDRQSNPTRSVLFL